MTYYNKRLRTDIPSGMARSVENVPPPMFASRRDASKKTSLLGMDASIIGCEGRDYRHFLPSDTSLWDVNTASTDNGERSTERHPMFARSEAAKAAGFGVANQPRKIVNKKQQIVIIIHY